MALHVFGDRVAVEPFAARRMTSEVTPGLKIAGSGLIGLRVVLAGSGFSPGDVVYFNSQDSVLPWAVERFVVDGQSFILAPKANVRLFDIAEHGVEPSVIDIQGGVAEKAKR